jgi:hypothetical protein
MNSGNKSDQEIKESGIEKIIPKFTSRPIFRFTWRGMNGQGGTSSYCDAGICGISIGFV